MHQATNGKKILTRLFLFLVLLASCYVAHAQAVGENDIGPAQRFRQEEKDWSLYPFTIQINPYLGFIPLRLVDLTDKKSKYDLLGLKGISTDFSLLYVKRAIWQYFDCYPRVGVTISYGRPANQGHILSGLLYIEPNYSHLAGWEFLTRLGIGAAYVKVPGNYPIKKKEEEDEEQDQDILEVDPFREEPSLALAWGLLWKWRLTPNWHLHAGLNFDYLPYLHEQGTDETNKDLLISTASLGVSYTINPSIYDYSRPQGPRKTRIDVAWLSGFRKPDSTLVKDDNAYYYVGGLYGQWSCQIVNNYAFTLATEWVKDLAAKKELEEKLKNDNLKVGFLLGHEFLWGKLIFRQQLGAYMLNDTAIMPPWGFFYTRLGLDYRLTNFLLLGVSLKTILLPSTQAFKKDKFARIELIDFKISYSF